MSLPTISGKKVIKALGRVGFAVEGKKGSHVKLKKKTGGKVLVVIVPDHTVIARGTLMSIIRQAALSKEEFLHLLR